MGWGGGSGHVTSASEEVPSRFYSSNCVLCSNLGYIPGFLNIISPFLLRLQMVVLIFVRHLNYIC